MFPSGEIKFFIEKRKNTFAHSGVEWALKIKINENDCWTLSTWDDEPPTEYDVEFCKKLCLRSMKIYHDHIKMPLFNLESN